MATNEADTQDRTEISNATVTLFDNTGGGGGSTPPTTGQIWPRGDWLPSS